MLTGLFVNPKHRCPFFLSLLNIKDYTSNFPNKTTSRVHQQVSPAMSSRSYESVQSFIAIQQVAVEISQSGLTQMMLRNY